MSDRVRRITLGVVLTAWSAVIVAYLIQGKLPDPAWAGVPPATILALAPLRRADPPAASGSRAAEDAS